MRSRTAFGGPPIRDLRLRGGLREAILACASAFASVACGASGGGEAPETSADAGVSDARDAGAIDASTSTEIDAGNDASIGDEDASPPRADLPAIACADTIAEVYVAPSTLPPMTMGTRGDVVRCAKDTSFSLADVASKLAAKNVAGVTPSSGTTFYRVAYRTYRDDGVAGLSTARVYLPTAPRALPLPVIAVAHPTEGLASSCAPSMNPTNLDDLALPWASQGYAVIATDYAGLGTSGVQGYVANHDEAHSLLDSARALRALLDPRALDSRVLLVGYSQGGGAVLASQGLVGSYGAGGNVVAGVVFAAEYFARMDSFQYVTMLRNPTELTIQTGISKPVVSAMRSFSLAYNLLGAANATAPFPSDQRGNMDAAITTLCQTPFGGYLQGMATHLGDIYDDAFRSALLACVDGQSGCSGPASAMVDWMKKDLVAPDPSGPPLLYMVGLSDIIMPPNEEAACNVDLLRAKGVSVQTCVDGPAQHTDIVPRNAAYALSWGQAMLEGSAVPPCASQGMPACAP